MDRRLLDNAALARSSVVANCAMNRERQLTGPNSYTRELGFNPLERLTGPGAAWLDLCCGTGRALAQAADQRRQGVLMGVDLVDAFVSAPDRSVQFISADVTTWTTNQRFALITCVHGLHYLGDKLGVLSRAAGWLADDGLLIADIDLASVRLPDGRPAGRALTAALRRAGLSYDSRRRRITCSGRREVSLPYTYLGADDRAGPNYTNQPAVDAYYQPRRW